MPLTNRSVHNEKSQVEDRPVELPPYVRYAAKSTEDANESIARQFETLNRYVQQKGWEPYGDPFSDADASAYHGSRGPGLSQAQSAVEHAAAGGRLVYLDP